MLVVLGSRLAISCGQSHKLLPAAQEAFTEILIFLVRGSRRLSSGGVEALGRSSVIRGQRNFKVQGA